MQKKAVLMICLMMLVATLTSVFLVKLSGADSTTICVHPGESIQAAIDAAKPGDTVFVYNGTYYENIFIIKTINLIGEDKNNTVIDGKRNGSVVYIVGVGVTLSGFTLQNSSREHYTHAGIEMYSGGNHIEGNIVTNNRVGIHLLFAVGLIPKGNNTLENNIIIDNDRDAFCVHCSNNTIQRNHMENNGGGVFLQQFARFNKIDENNFINNTYDSGHYRAIFNTWDNNYWDDWIGLKNPLMKLCPKMIPKYVPFLGEFRKLPWPSFDFHPALKPYEI
jgi:parallel beta-helix repeat protein